MVGRGSQINFLWTTAMIITITKTSILIICPFPRGLLLTYPLSPPPTAMAFRGKLPSGTLGHIPADRLHRSFPDINHLPRLFAQPDQEFLAAANFWTPFKTIVFMQKRENLDMGASGPCSSEIRSLHKKWALARSLPVRRSARVTCGKEDGTGNGRLISCS